MLDYSLRSESQNIKTSLQLKRKKVEVVNENIVLLGHLSELSTKFAPYNL